MHIEQTTAFDEHASGPRSTSETAPVIPIHRRTTPLCSLDIFGHHITDVVAHAGGWLFDRAMTGWAVTVIMSAASDPRPLQILGARAIDIDSVLRTGSYGRRPHTVAMGCDAWAGDTRIPDTVHTALTDAETLVWGEPAPRDDQAFPAASPLVHTLSNAARAFKTQALVACGVEGAPVTAVEVFHRASPIRADAAGSRRHA